MNQLCKPTLWMALTLGLLISMLSGCHTDEYVEPIVSQTSTSSLSQQKVHYRPVDNLREESLLLNALETFRPDEHMTGDPLLQTLYGTIDPTRIKKAQLPGSLKITYYLYIDNLSSDFTWMDLIITLEPGKPITGYTRDYKPDGEWLYDTRHISGSTYSGVVETKKLYAKTNTLTIYKHGRPVKMYTRTPNSLCDQDPGDPVDDGVTSPGDDSSIPIGDGSPDGCVYYTEPSHIINGATNLWQDCGNGARIIHTYTSPCDDYVDPDAEGDLGGGGTGDSGSDPDPAPEPEFNPEGLRAAVLTGLLENDPDALIDLPCEELAKYQAIANMEMPTEVIDRLQSLEQDRTKWEKLAPYTGWEIQSLNDASGFQVSLDHYGINIGKLPTGMSPEQLLQHIRRNINDFIDTDVSVFTPHPDLPGEELLWHGSPLASIIQIDMYSLFGNIDDGSVICSDYQPTSWTFSTIKCPADFQHPVAGNRKFAIEQQSDGTYEIYTSGVDRIMAGTDEVVANLGEFIFGYNAVFVPADSLWSSFQDKVGTYIIENGGEATVPTVRNTGSRVDYYKIEDYLNGNIELSDIRNDCI